jgi:hypothetical protein
MLLSINESKIAELLKSTDKKYAVFASDVPIVAENCKPTYPTTIEVSGAVYGAPLLITEETREHLMMLRRKIEESGVPLKNAEVLTREIDEMRGRR